MRLIPDSLFSLAFALMLSSAGALADPVEGEKARRKAVCPVCRVREGATIPEPVRATRVHEGASYDFCSEKCARVFERSPAAFIGLAAPADSTLRAPLLGRISSAPT